MYRVFKQYARVTLFLLQNFYVLTILLLAIWPTITIMLFLNLLEDLFGLMLWVVFFRIFWGVYPCTALKKCYKLKAVRKIFIEKIQLLPVSSWYRKWSFFLQYLWMFRSFSSTEIDTYRNNCGGNLKNYFFNCVRRAPSFVGKQLHTYCTTALYITPCDYWAHYAYLVNFIFTSTIKKYQLYLWWIERIIRCKL